jgi:transcriptional regulator with XRE-family HTH domain
MVGMVMDLFERVDHGAIDATLSVVQSMPMNTRWFRDRLKGIELSQRGLAKLLDVDAAAVSYMLRGKRKMSLHEANRIAQILGVPASEVMRQAGIKVDDNIKRVPVSGVCDAAGNINMLAPKTHEKIIAPADVPADSYAVQVRSPGHTKDGWVFFVASEQREPRDQIDSMCLCALADGTQVLAYVRRGYRKDAFNLTLSTDSGKLLQDQQVSWASPVLWIKP